MISKGIQVYREKILEWDGGKKQITLDPEQSKFCSIIKSHVGKISSGRLSALVWSVLGHQINYAPRATVCLWVALSSGVNIRK